MRRVLLALGSALLLGAAATVGASALKEAGSTPPPNHGSSEEQKRDEASHRAADAAGAKADVVVGAQKPEEPIEKKPCGDIQGDEHRQLCFERESAISARESAVWAARSYWIGVIGTVGLAGTIIGAWTSIRQSSKALRAQQALDRPIFIVKSAALSKAERFIGLSLLEVTNDGMAAGWLETACIRLSDTEFSEEGWSTPAHPISIMIGTDKTVEFDAADLGFAKVEDRGMVSRIRSNDCCYVTGYLIYRNGNQNRWRTGFSAMISWSSGKFTLRPDPHHWVDESLDDKEPWFRRVLKAKKPGNRS